MNTDFPPDTQRAQNPIVQGDGTLDLNPGAPHRKSRSVIKLCLWLALLTCILFGGIGVYYVVNNLWDGLRHPHRSMYYDKPDTEVSDWSQVVRPMITRDSKFDVVASVWTRDDTAEDGTIRIDGKDRTERLIYSGTVFHDVHLKSKNVFANVTLSIPTGHFTRPNILNYDLRASFVLAQRDKPSWLNFVKNYTSWRPQEIVAPTIRKWEGEPSLEDQIYDSFGITIPLIQFHNVTRRRAVQLTENETADITTPEDTDGDMNSDDESNWNDEELAETPSKDQHEKKNSFDLEFTGERKSTTEHHPYIVTRTHIRVADETKLFKRQSYEKAQKGVANRLCAYPVSNSSNGHPQWYQCSRSRSYLINGVFETKVQLRMPPKSSELKNSKKRKTEWLYAPFMSATKRAPGPKDLVLVPTDRETVVEGAIPRNPTSEYVTVTWKLSFSGRTPHKLAVLDAINPSQPIGYNMTAPDSELEDLQYKHDLAMGLFGHRIHGDAHPRRVLVLELTSTLIQIICWFLTIHYWYSRTSTTGISRFGATFLACSLLIDANEQVFLSIFRPGATGHWLMRIPVTYIFSLIPPFVMLKTAARLEFGWSTNTRDSTKQGWTPRVYFAKATHLERASDRVGGRVSRRIKLALLVFFFAFFHFLTPSSAYLLRPRIPQTTEESYPPQTLSPRTSAILGCIKSLSSSLGVTASILQFIMNGSSRTYAGRYKVATFLWLISELLALLDLVPHVVGRSTRLGGVFVADGIALLISVVDAVQAVRYRRVKRSDVGDAE